MTQLSIGTVKTITPGPRTTFRGSQANLVGALSHYGEDLLILEDDDTRPDVQRWATLTKSTLQR